MLRIVFLIFSLVAINTYALPFQSKSSIHLIFPVIDSPFFNFSGTKLYAPQRYPWSRRPHRRSPRRWKNSDPTRRSLRSRSVIGQTIFCSQSQLRRHPRVSKGHRFGVHGNYRSPCHPHHNNRCSRECCLSSLPTCHS